MDQIFAVKILVKKYLEWDRKLFASFMNLEKAYDRVDRKGLWQGYSVTMCEGLDTQFCT